MPDIMQGANPRMIQRRNRPCLPLKALLQIRIGRKVLWQDLDRHCPIKPRVARTIHFAHTSSAERRLNFIGTKFCTRGEGHACAPLYRAEQVTGDAAILALIFSSSTFTSSTRLPGTAGQGRRPFTRRFGSVPSVILTVQDLARDRIGFLEFLAHFAMNG